jgi:hypothetical protein
LMHLLLSDHLPRWALFFISQQTECPFKIFYNCATHR